MFPAYYMNPVKMAGTDGLSSTSSNFGDAATSVNGSSMTPIETYVDVLIIGAGPAGIMCANGLAKAGVNVRIVDKRCVLLGFGLRLVYLLPLGVSEWKGECGLGVRM